MSDDKPATTEELKSEIAALEARLDDKLATKQDLAEVRTDLKQDLADVKVELTGSINTAVEHLREELTGTIGTAADNFREENHALEQRLNSRFDEVMNNFDALFARDEKREQENAFRDEQTSRLEKRVEVLEKKVA